MTVKAKEIVNGKFWILENEGIKIATLSLSDNLFLLNDKNGSRFHSDEKSVETDIGNTIIWDELKITELPAKEIYGYLTNTIPYNPIYDIKNKLPLFTKSKKSKSLYSAGYYIIQFDKGWVKSFCPKLITLERYNYQGPFKTKMEMKTALKNQNGKRTD